MAADPESHQLTPKRLALLIVGLLAFSALTWWRLHEPPAQPRLQMSSISGETMGTTYHIKAVSEDGGDVHWARLRMLVPPQLVVVNRLMSTYDPDSELSRFNRSDSTESMPISAATAQVVSAALKVSEQTAGAFDVTLGPIVNAYGFGPDERGDPPTDEDLARLRERVGYEKLTVDLEAPALRKDRPDVYVDLSAIAKGYAVDHVAEILERQGICNYLVEIGGEVRARGHNRDGKVWRVGIETPREDERAVQQVIALDGLSMATSGDYRNYYEVDGKRIGHTLDGRTGRPITHNLASVSVIHAECMWADAYATAIMALGPDDGYLMAKLLDLSALLLLRQPDGSFTERATPAFEAQFGAGA